MHLIKRSWHAMVKGSVRLTLAMRPTVEEGCLGASLSGVGGHLPHSGEGGTFVAPPPGWRPLTPPPWRMREGAAARFLKDLQSG